MDWQGDFPQDQASVDWAIVGLPGDLDIQQLLRDTEEKLKLNACRSVPRLVPSPLPRPPSPPAERTVGDEDGGSRPCCVTSCSAWRRADGREMDGRVRGDVLSERRRPSLTISSVERSEACPPRKAARWTLVGSGHRATKTGRQKPCHDVGTAGHPYSVLHPQHCKNRK